MANYVLQELPEEMTDGRKVLFPRMQTYTLHDFDTVLKHMHTYAGSFSEGMMRAVIDALIETMKSWMPMGHSIKIDGLGVFSLSLGFDTSTPSEQTMTDDSTEKEAKTKYRHICIKGINFKPDAELLKEMNREATFERNDAEVKTPQKSLLSREERIAKAKAIIEARGYLTLTDYTIACGLSRSSASRDLRSLVADPTSGITTRGSHSHKVWVLG
jgi:nucleoid DNA-binding protein